jgi:hypothetical protein
MNGFATFLVDKLQRFFHEFDGLNVTQQEATLFEDFHYTLDRSERLTDEEPIIPRN